MQSKSRIFLCNLSRMTAKNPRCGMSFPVDLDQRQSHVVIHG
jgi:hypothetical protein